MRLPSPQSQKVDVRPISFHLDDSASGERSPDAVTLAIRPEDLTRTEPSRVAIHQTLGGAWADNFGPGIGTITIAGHTGWTRRLGDQQKDGMERFIQLHDQVFKQWHERRAAAVKAGKDPDGVRLVFADALDRFMCVVAPQSFTLRRSKSRPLLCQYQIVMTVLSEQLDQALEGDALTADERERTGLDSMLASVREIATHARDIKDHIDGKVVAPVRKFMDKTVQVYETVSDAVRAADDVADSLIAVAQTTAAAGANIFRTIDIVFELPTYAQARVMEVASAYTNIYCAMRNALRGQSFYPDYSPLFGASNCSSTAGGDPISPLAGTNPFYIYAPNSPQLPIQLSEQARASLQTMAATDVVLSPMNEAELTAALFDVAEGMVVA